ncbi:MAG: MoaD/ThiS family protein [Methanomicrobia archaeon]|nr:MoaD/ThiS family protein [Methanomicrobia archaeon]HDM22426.1 thiamine biosynthesis protein ThiS [Methanomicrobia archaeon]
MIKVRLLRENKEKFIEYSRGLKIEDILESLGYSSETAVVKRNGKISIEDEYIEDNDELLIIPVISGG